MNFIGNRYSIINIEDNIEFNKLYKARDLYENNYSYLYYAGMENGIGRLAFSLEIFSEKIHNIPNFESYIGELLEIGVGESIDNANIAKS